MANKARIMSSSGWLRIGLRWITWRIGLRWITWIGFRSIFVSATVCKVVRRRVCGSDSVTSFRAWLTALFSHFSPQTANSNTRCLVTPLLITSTMKHYLNSSIIPPTPKQQQGQQHAAAAEGECYNCERCVGVHIILYILLNRISPRNVQFN